MGDRHLAPALAVTARPFSTAGLWGDGYDASKRQPDFAGAEASPLWELQALAQHFHPTVRLFAQRLMSREKVPAPQLHESSMRVFHVCVFHACGPLTTVAARGLVWRTPVRLPDSAAGGLCGPRAE